MEPSHSVYACAALAEGLAVVMLGGTAPNPVECGPVALSLTLLPGGEGQPGISARSNGKSVRTACADRGGNFNRWAGQGVPYA